MQQYGMDTQVVLGIVIKTVRVKEADVRIHLLTANGVRTATATGALKPAAKLKNAVQLFTIAEFCIAGTRITGAHVIQSPMGLTRDINRYYLAGMLCDVTERLRLTENTSDIFILTAKTLGLLNETDTSCFKLFINYFTKLLIDQGYDTEQNKNKFDEFKQTDTDAADTIKLTLTEAKAMIKHLANCFIKHLDTEIPNIERFLNT